MNISKVVVNTYIYALKSKNIEIKAQMMALLYKLDKNKFMEVKQILQRS